MTRSRADLIARYVGALGVVQDGEAALLPPLVRWLVATGRLGQKTRVAREVPLHGRHVDLALLTDRGLASAFELKIGRLQRATEQAAYNLGSFHRSWIVTASRPREEGLVWVRALGLGVIVVRDDRVAAVVAASFQRPHPAAVTRLRAAIRLRAVPAT